MNDHITELLTSRLDDKGNAADVYYRRNLWLLLFGIVHAYLLWAGDILYPYALCALVLYPFRHMEAKRLLMIGGVLVFLTSAASIGKGVADREMLEKGRAAVAAQTAGKKLSAEHMDELDAYEQWRKFNRPTVEELGRVQLRVHRVRLRPLRTTAAV